MTDKFYDSFHDEPMVYYAESSTFIDAMDYIEFMREADGWQVLVPPFPTKIERVGVYKMGGGVDWMDNPIEWGFVLHRFN